MQENTNTNGLAEQDRSAQQSQDTSRRSFLGALGMATAVSITARRADAASPEAADSIPQGPPAGTEPAASAPGGNDRIRQSFLFREHAAIQEARAPLPVQLTNGDEQLYPNFIGNYSKCLPHNAIGEVEPAAYKQFVEACNTGTADAFEALPLAGPTPLGNPLSGLAFDLEGADSRHVVTAPPPTLASEDRAADALELYWKALSRDNPITEFATNPHTRAAAAELSALPGFTGPKIGGAVTAQTLFRGFTPDSLIGPHVSQLLLRPVIFDTYPAGTGQLNVFVPGVEYQTDQASWLGIQNGGAFGAVQLDPQPRFVRNGRDLASLVHPGGEVGPFIAAANWLALVANAPLNPGNPYLKYKKQSPLITFGPAHFPWLIAEAYQRAEKAAWGHKFYVHRTVRPEEYGGLVHMNLTKQASYPLPSDVLHSEAVARTRQKFGSYFLPQAYPEGCPTLPSYPSGHGAGPGACATILKVIVNGAAPFSSLQAQPEILVPNVDGTSLLPYEGADAGQLTINSEINKLAGQIAFSRNWAGIHWRSDDVSGLLLGEEIAISILRDQRAQYKGENFAGFTITKFDGTVITI